MMFDDIFGSDPVSEDFAKLKFSPVYGETPSLLFSAPATQPTITLPPAPTPPTGGVGITLNSGNDGVVLGGADDIVFGDDGNDEIYGQGGDDQIFGEDGIDRLIGGDGNDILDGGASSDVLIGGAGADTLVLGDGNDTAYGQDGDDLIFGGAGSDTIFGGAGADRVDGGAGIDVIIAGDGNDMVLAGSGDDVVYGQVGDDQVDGGGGNDTVYGGMGNDTLIGGAGLDLLVGQSGDDSLFGGDGNDTLYSGAGDDFIDGGADTDTIFGGDGNDTLFGGAGHDLLSGEDGQDDLDGGTGNDVVNGQAGNDRVTGGEGDNIVLGGTGADVFYQAGTGIDRIQDFQLGIDKLEISKSVSDIAALLAGAQDNIDANGNQTVIISNGESGFFVLSNLLAANLSVSDFVYVNDAPVVTSGPTATVVENQTTAFTASATDAEGATLAYSLSGTDAALFDIEAATGVVTFKSAPDFEAPGDADADNVYDVIITASDGTNRTSECVAITVTNENDLAPVFTFNQTVFVTEGQTEALIAQARDADEDMLTYSLSGTDAALFNIDAATGAVTFKRAPDFDAPGDADGDNVYDVIVTANDTLNSTDQAVTITVTNQNDNAPVFSSGAAVSVLENQTAAYTATASDADGNQIFYSLSGPDAALFSIDVSTGVVTFNAAPDFEIPADAGANNVYDIVVTADDGVNQTNQAVAITVEDVAETIAPINLGALGSSGFRIDGAVANDTLGVSVSSAGDINGDGFDDFIIGAPYADNNGRNVSGSSYVIFGSAGTAQTDIDLSNLGTTGFRIDGAVAVDIFGLSVSSAGDVNGDGFDDLIVGGAYADNNGRSKSGSSYVIFGSAGTAQADIDLSNLGTAGFRIDGAAVDDVFGYSVSAAGDVNGDGFDDLIIGARGTDPNGLSSGSSYVLFGDAGIEEVAFDLSNLGGAGFRIDGAAAGDLSGHAVSSAGDVNGDGFDDLIVGAYTADPNGSNSGASYVIFGSAGTAQVDIDLSVNLGTAGFRIDGAAALDRSGRSVSSAGDVNGDGFDDLIVGAAGADPNGFSSGSSYIIFGSAGTAQVDIDLSVDLGSSGFRIDGAAFINRVGNSVSSAGDVNGDGFDDLLVGAYTADPNGVRSGSSYVIFGSAGTHQADVDLSADLGLTGFRIDGAAARDSAGASVSSAGDVNGDGFDDLIVGARGADNNSRDGSGSSYIIFGGATGTESTVAVTSAGSVSVDNFTGNAGDDTFTAISTGDVVRGGAGDDRITVTSLDFADIRGGTGVDTLVLNASGLNLDATTAGNASLGSIEVFDITGSGDNRLTLNAQAVFDLTEERSGGTATLDVLGNAGDQVTILGFTAGAQVIEDGVTYNTYADGNATIRVQDDVAVTTVGIAAEPLDNADTEVLAADPATGTRTVSVEQIADPDSSTSTYAFDEIPDWSDFLTLDALGQANFEALTAGTKASSDPVSELEFFIEAIDAKATLTPVAENTSMEEVTRLSIAEDIALNKVDVLVIAETNGADDVSVNSVLLFDDHQSWGNVFASLSVGRDNHLSKVSGQADDMINDLSFNDVDQSLYGLDEFEFLSVDYVSEGQEPDSAYSTESTGSDFSAAQVDLTLGVDDGAFL